MPYDVIHPLYLAAVFKSPHHLNKEKFILASAPRYSPVWNLSKPQVFYINSNPRHPTVTNFQALSHLTNPNPALAHPTHRLAMPP